MAEFIDTMPRVIPITLTIDAADITATGSTDLLPNPAFRSERQTRIVGVVIYKEIPFDNGAILELGHGTTSGSRESMASAAEFAADTAGVSEPEAWKGATGYGNALASGNTRLVLRVTGGVPSVGRARLILLTINLSPRAVP